MGDWLDLSKNHKFVQDNRMIKAQYSRNISLIGQKIVRIAIANVNSVDDDTFFTYRVKLSHLAKLLEIEKNKDIYRDVKKAAGEILETKILIEQERKKGSFRQYNLFSYFDYNDGEGTVTIRFNPDMNEFLLKLKKDFTQIALEDVLFMSHKYSIRIYELIRMKLKRAKVYGDQHKKIEITVDEIRKATNTVNIYKQIGQLKDFVLLPALKDIENNASYHCEMEYIKEGRKIVGFELDVWSINGWQYKQLQSNQIDGQLSLFDESPEEPHIEN